MATDLSSMRIDTDKDKTPVPFYLGREDGDGCIWAVRPGNPESQAENARLTKKHALELKRDKTGMVEMEITAKVWFRTIFKKWENILFDGPLELTEKNCILLFTDPAYNDLRQMFVDIVIGGVDDGEFRVHDFTPDEIEATVKN